MGPNDDAVRVNLGRELNDLAHRVARAQMNAYGDPAQAVHQGGLFVDVEAKVLMSSLDRSADGCVWELAVQQDEIGDHRQPILTYARSRLRSDQAAQILRGIGFHDVFSMGTLTGAERQATGRLV